MDLEKMASEGQGTYLDKVATIVLGYQNGEISAEEADAIAEENGIDPADVASVYTAEIEKYASAEYEDEAVLNALVKVATDDDSSYLDKCAAIADLFASDALTGEEADEFAAQMGIDPEDVEAVFTSAYADDLEKDAGEKWDKTKDFFTRDFKAGKAGHAALGKAHDRKANYADAVKIIKRDRSLSTAERAKALRSAKRGLKAGRSTERKALGNIVKNYAKGAGKIGGTLGAAGLAGYGAYHAVND